MDANIIKAVNAALVMADFPSMQPEPIARIIAELGEQGYAIVAVPPVAETHHPESGEPHRFHDGELCFPGCPAWDSKR